MTFLFYVLSVLLIFLSFRSFRGGMGYLAHVRSELGRKPSAFTPFASIIAPCKGIEVGLKENLAALHQQDYPAYEVIFVVDNEDDPAVRVIEEASANYPQTKLVVAGAAVGSAQKIENLREAVLHIAGESRVLVFVDSDARPGPNWLASLVAPLADAKIGAATGYRWFISKTPSFASAMRSAWNASIASALGPNLKSNFCWGGSMAIRRDVFDTLDIRGKWHGALSDDFVVTRTMKAANLDIYYAPQALTPSIENCSFGEMLEFTTRQMKITRVYASILWKLSFFGSALFNITLLWALLIVLTNPISSFPFVAAALTIILVTVFSIGKSHLRLKAVRLVLTQYEPELKRQFLAQNTLWLLAPAVFLYNSVAALLSRRMKWRGINYELISPTETRIISD
ncbi:MAG: glycosyltransferase [Acidobacteriota bacterium]